MRPETYLARFGALLLFTAGCGSESSMKETDSGPGGRSGTDTDGSMQMDGSMHMGGSAHMGGALNMDASSNGAGGSATGGPPQAPLMLAVTPMGGGLHVEWRNNSGDCSKVELLRNKDGGAYALAYTLAGSATSQHDLQAAGSSMYCYKARCMKGADTSQLSNEKCGMQ